MSKDNAKPEDEFSKLFPLTNDLPPLVETTPSMADLNAMLEAQNKAFASLPSDAQNLDNLTQMLNADAANLKIEGDATRLQNVEPRLSRRDAVQIARLDTEVLPPRLSFHIGCTLARVIVDDLQKRDFGEDWFKSHWLVGSVKDNAEYLHSQLIRHPSKVFDAQYPNMTEAHWAQIAACLEQSEKALAYAFAVLDSGAE